MENQSKNTGLYVVIGILCVLVLLLGGYIIYDKVLSNKCSSVNNNGSNVVENNNQSNDNTISNNDEINATNNNGNTQEQTQGDDNKIDETSFIRDTRVVLVEEPNCTGQHSTSLIANIEPNGNISIAQDRGAAEIKVGNAKYLYKVGILACDNVKLYYITGDKELYVIDRPSSTALNQKGTKVIESKIVEFLGTEGRNDGSYLKVLNDNGKIEYVKYFTSPN